MKSIPKWDSYEDYGYSTHTEHNIHKNNDNSRLCGLPFDPIDQAIEYSQNLLEVQERENNYYSNE